MEIPKSTIPESSQIKGFFARKLSSAVDITPNMKNLTNVNECKSSLPYIHLRLYVGKSVILHVLFRFIICEIFPSEMYTFSEDYVVTNSEMSSRSIDKMTKN